MVINKLLNGMILQVQSSHLVTTAKSGIQDMIRSFKVRCVWKKTWGPASSEFFFVQT